MSEYIIKKTAYEPDYNNKTLKEIYEHILKIGHNTDKGTTHCYSDTYEELLKPYRQLPINLFEIGADYGYSLSLWRKYFPLATIYGIDNRNVLQFNTGINVVFGDIKDPTIANKTFAGIDFDVIIDDGSHILKDQVEAFKLYFPKLRKGGIYVIEDIQWLDAVSWEWKETGLIEGDVLKALDPSAEVIDLRKVQGRYDDILMVYRK